MQSYDAIVVGAGHNGLVTALYLARGGWRVLVLERNAEVGGAIRSGEVTLPGFVHDLYSTNQNLFVLSPVYQELEQDFTRHGLRFVRTDTPVCNVYPNGSSVHIYRDVERTRAEIQARHPEDVEGWRQLELRHQLLMQTLFPLYATPLPSLKAAGIVWKSLKTVGIKPLLDLFQLLLKSPRELANAYFSSAEMKAVIACWGLHLDFAPDTVGGTLFPLTSAFEVMDKGISLAEGGASKISEALAAMIREAGGEIRTNAEVRHILTKRGRATGVELANGEQIGARRAVVANLTPKTLFGSLLDTAAVPYAARQRAEQYVYSPATMMIHLALSAPPQWAAGDHISQFSYVHIAPYIEDLATAYTQAMNGELPTNPLLIVGQTSAVDPSRVSGEGAILYIQVRPLPGQIRGDARGEIEARDWADAREAFADRVMQKLEAYAPGISALVLKRVVYSPQDLARHVPNWVDGDTISGSHHLQQNFLFRPFWGASRYRMPVRNLYMVGAATWPGAGNNATSGYLAAQQLLARRTLPLGGLAALLAAVVGGWLLLRRR
ncbi:MAG: NAD(P)/FAD-dependent oxidoreductase [Chloroflexota bacterium]|nr:NAD(P)/FAD-dependent oxidoreductase [Chloroflexota bacterium]